MKKLSLILLICILVPACSKRTIEWVDYVNPMIGTAPSQTVSALKHGIDTENNAQVIPAVTMPFGMTNWTPQTRNVETKCVAPYYYEDSLITGFRGSHWLSGSCTQDYGSVTLMPITKMNNLLPSKRGSKYSHKDEISTPYYYKVLLNDYNVVAEMTATNRTGILKFTYNNTDTGIVVLEPNSDEGEGYIKIIPERNEVVGYNPVHRIYQGWGENAGFSGYFVARFDHNFTSFGIYEGGKIHNNEIEIANKESIGGFVSFDLSESKTVIVTVGTSFTSIEGARKNLEAETRALTFDLAKEQLKEKWNEILSRIELEKANQVEKIKFYTALYHCCFQPRTFNDCDGSYPCFADCDSICNSVDDNYYCDFSVWDTYRALHPLLNLLLPEYSKGMVKSLMNKAKQGGWLPIFPCWNSYTSAMIGDHVISVIADAYLKGIIDLTEEEYNYLRKNASQLPKDFNDYLNGKGRRALKSYLRYGYIPLEDEVKESFHQKEQVSRTLEYAYDDYALSQIAKKMGKEEDYKYFLERSKNYINVYDLKVKSVRGKYKNGTFTDEFIKTERMPYITEGTPWQYTWYVPHDVNGLMKLMGGKDEFISNLDEFFFEGQYWHGNEPCHHIPFLYIYAGQPEKTRSIVKKILNEEYSTKPGGLCGNDDSGQLSAWYVFATMGFYPVCPAKDEYTIFAPSIEEIKINFSNDKSLKIMAKGIKKSNKIVKGIILNCTKIENNIITYEQLINGGTLEFITE